jgi:hypothetical protein
MLIYPNGYKKDVEVTRGPLCVPKAKNPKAPQIVCKTIPDGKDGRRIPSTRELFELLNDPKVRQAVSTIEREYGCETKLKRMVRTQLKNDRLSRIHAAVQAKAIELSVKKQKGLL